MKILMKILIFVIVLIIGIIATFLIDKENKPRIIIMGIIATVSLGLATSFAYSGIVFLLEKNEQTQEVLLDNNSNYENVDDNNNIDNVSSTQNIEAFNNSAGTQESVPPSDYIEDVSDEESSSESMSVNNNTDKTINGSGFVVGAEIDENDYSEELKTIDGIGFVVEAEMDESDDLEELEPESILLSDVVWLEDEKVYKNISATTMRGEQWSDCIGFGDSNINSDGQAILIAACDQKYSKFIAEIAPQEGFDKSEKVTLCIYGACDGEQISKKEFSIDFMTESFKIELDISGAKELYIWKLGNYNMGRIAGQYINGNSGMGVILRDATLCK